MKQHRGAPLLSSTAYQLIVYGNVVLYSICWMAQAPVLPYLVENLGAAGSAQYGTLQTIFSAVQFIGGLISGPLMDRYGGRFLLAISFAASVACYGLTATASSVWLLYLSRLPTVLQHAVLAARAIVTQLSSEADRARVLGYVAVSYSVGFMVGPAVGGLLSSVSLQFAAWMATLGSVLSLATVVLLLPDLPLPGSSRGGQDGQGHDTGRSETRRASGAGSGEQCNGVKGHDGEEDGGTLRQGGARRMLLRFVEVARRPGVPDLLVGKLLCGLGSAVFQSMFPVLLKHRYGLDPRTNGMVMSYVGALLLAGQALLVGPVISAVGEPATEYGCAVGLVVTFGALATAGALWQLLALLVPLSVAGMLYNNASTSRLTKATLPQQRGTALSIDMSLSSGVRMLSPSLGAAALDALGHRAVPALSAALVGCFLLALQLRFVSIPIRPAVTGKGGGSDAGQGVCNGDGTEGRRRSSAGGSGAAAGKRGLWSAWLGSMDRRGSNGKGGVGPEPQGGRPAASVEGLQHDGAKEE